jgi:hypothetical protein
MARQVRFNKYGGIDVLYIADVEILAHPRVSASWLFGQPASILVRRESAKVVWTQCFRQPFRQAKAATLQA